MKNRTHVIMIIGIVSAVVFAACGSSGSGKSGSASAQNTFVVSEFTVIPPTNTLRAGSVTLTANNVGGEMHELLIVRAPNINTLPKKSDGSVNEVEIAAADKVGEIKDVAAESQKSKTFDLAAGTYVAFCNIVDAMMGSSSSMADMNGSGTGSGTGHVHFAEGMNVTFTVS